MITGKKPKRKKLNPFAVILSLVLITTLGIGCGYQLVSTLYPIAYKEEIISASHRYDLPPQLLFALINAESSFNPEAVSPAGARGLTQITSDTFDWIKWRKGDNSDTDYDDIFTPEIAIDYGAYLLSLHLEEFGSIEKALIAYNAGRGTLLSWLEDDEYSQEIDGVSIIHTIPYKETANYVDKILDSMEIYNFLYGV